MANDIGTADAGLAPMVEIAAGKLRGLSQLHGCRFIGIARGARGEEDVVRCDRERRHRRPSDRGEGAP